MIKLICRVCNSRVKRIEICSSEILLKTSYWQGKEGLIFNNENVFKGFVDKIVYKCNCGEMTVNKSLIRSLDTFLDVCNIKPGIYGTLEARKK